MADTAAHLVYRALLIVPIRLKYNYATDIRRSLTPQPNLVLFVIFSENRAALETSASAHFPNNSNHLQKTNNRAFNVYKG
jgi:hypothetical protein